MIRRDITGPTTDMTIAIGSWRDQSDNPLFVLGVRTLLWFMPAAIIGAIVWLVLR